MTAQPLHLARLQLIINLHPAQSGNITTGVQQFLNGLLLRCAWYGMWWHACVFMHKCTSDPVV